MTTQAPPMPSHLPEGLPHPPVFDTPAQERLHRKQMLAAAFRLFAKFGFSEGVAGHITARDPERDDCFWVNPFGMHFGLIRASDLLLVSHDGEVIEGETLPFDRRLLLALRQAGNPGVQIGPSWLPEMMRDISALGSTFVLGLILLAVTGYLLLVRKRAAALR